VEVCSTTSCPMNNCRASASLACSCRPAGGFDARDVGDRNALRTAKRLQFDCAEPNWMFKIRRRLLGANRAQFQMLPSWNVPALPNRTTRAEEAGGGTWN